MRIHFENIAVLAKIADELINEQTNEGTKEKKCDLLRFSSVARNLKTYIRQFCFVILESTLLFTL